jgi:integral membrane protein (TIGR01906 family)
MKIITSITRIIFVVSVPFLLFTAVIAGLVNSSWFYTNGFEKYNVKQSIAENGLSLTDADMSQIARSFIHYFNYSDEYIIIPGQPSIFNTEELIHFKDVKKLFRLDYAVLLGTFIYCLFFSLINIFALHGVHRKKLAADLIKGSGLTLVLMLAFGIGTLINFDGMFYDFHLLVFTNIFWSAEGNMLLLFPDGFWHDGAIYCASAITILALVLGGISWTYLAKHRKEI